MHVYSIDEVFIDATPYLKMYKISAHNFVMKLIREVLQETGITVTADIGTNMYLAKIRNSRKGCSFLVIFCIYQKRTF